MTKRVVLLVLLLIVFLVPLGAEEIQLKDGNKITGKVISVTEDAFQIKFVLLLLQWNHFSKLDFQSSRRSPRLTAP